MKLRQRLLKEQSNPELQSSIIWDLKPLEITPFDMKALLLISKGRRNDRLAHLGMEAKWWTQEHRVLLRKRFVRATH